jgi:HlyD family type I secretion membrane fusion protein
LPTPAGARERRARAEAEFRRSVHARLIEAERVAVSLAQELAKAERHAAFQTLAAPIDGTVQQLAVHTVGGVVAAGETLLLVVPEDDELEVECRVLNRDIGFLAAGQVAQVKLEAFPFTIYGTVEGRVRDVGRDAADDPLLGPVFPTRVRLARQDIVVDGRPVRLAAGMRATVDVVTERRRAIEFLLAPLLRLAGEAWRER